MASMESLPTELLLCIVRQFQSNEIGSPITGVNACWTSPDPLVQLRHKSPSQHDDYRSLLILRQTNRFFNITCIPYIFQELNLLTASELEHVDIPLRYANHIRTLRIRVDPRLAEKDLAPEAHLQALEKVLSVCRNIVSLGIYHLHSTSSWGGITQAALSLVEGGTVEALGLYSLNVVRRKSGYWDWNYINPSASNALLVSIGSSPTAAKFIKRMDIALETMPMRTYDLLRSNFTALESLNVRRAFRVWSFDDRTLGRLMDREQAQKWHAYENLTTLNLIDCSSAYAPHIPELVRLFKSLKYMIISTCGCSTDTQIAPEHDWNTKSDALWRVRLPLTVLHLEHMLEWEILALGVIPASKLIFSNTEPGHIADPFRYDTRIFPGVRELSIEELDTELAPEEECKEKEEHAFLASLCNERSIELRKDAKWIKKSRR